MQKIPEIKPLMIGIKFQRDAERLRIAQRLKARLENGLIEEVRSLLDSGLTPQELKYYGLEYKYITLYIEGKISLRLMEEELCTAICQFSKRQMTWFRKMEREGTQIHWLSGDIPDEKKTDIVLELMKQG